MPKNSFFFFYFSIFSPSSFDFFERSLNFWYFEFMWPRIKKIRGLLQALLEYKNAKNNRTTAYINDFTA